MPANKFLYFIAIILPQVIGDEVTAFKNDLAERFQSKASLKVIPHITLKAPFKRPEQEQEQTLQWFSNMRLTVSSFHQVLNNFGAFHNKHSSVIFVSPVMNLSLENLHKEVISNFRSNFPHEQVTEQEMNYKPHVTLAYRDLKPECFKEAWKEYQRKQYNAIFPVNSIQLLQHSSKGWITLRELHLK